MLLGKDDKTLNKTLWLLFFIFTYKDKIRNFLTASNLETRVSQRLTSIQNHLSNHIATTNFVLFHQNFKMQITFWLSWLLGASLCVVFFSVLYFNFEDLLSTCRILLCCSSFKLYSPGLWMPLCMAWIKLNCIHWEFHNPSPSVLLSESCGKLESETKLNLCIKSAALHATQSIRAPLYLFQMNAQAIVAQY